MTSNRFLAPTSILTLSLFAGLAIAQDASSESVAAPAPEASADRIHAAAGVDFTNKYFFRGIVQERSGFIVQPWASVSLDLMKNDSWELQGTLGTWGSYHDTATASSNTDGFVKKWYEADIYATLALTKGDWSAKATYTIYASPSDAFETIQDLTFTLAYDDSSLLGAWALNPAVSLAVETGSNFADGAGTNRGVYLEPSISPGFTLDNGIGGCMKGVSVTFPVVLGLSLSDYYEDGAGEDDTFGFLSVGAKASVPLNCFDGFGDWSLNLGAQGLFLGDHTKGYNSGHDSEFVVTAGLSVAF